MRTRASSFTSLALPAVSLVWACALSGCSTIGAVLSPGIGPVDEKSHSYRVLDLSKDDSDWTKLDPKKVSGDDASSDESSTEISDLAFQSKSTASIITLNSNCRDGGAVDGRATERELQDVSRLLLLGFTDITLREEAMLDIQGTSALQTTVKGLLPEDPSRDTTKRIPMMLRAVVLKPKRCTYELVYISIPDHFHKKEEDFNRFVSSLLLK
jgi:hypothetical protein